MAHRKVVGLSEKVTISKGPKSRTLMGKVDTGATRSSIDTKIAKELSLGPIIRSKLIKSALGNSVRPIVEAHITIAGKTFKTEFTVADRSHMKYKVLIGVSVLKKGFLIDPRIK